jgi:ATP-dependent exoDNAse (exonuclease V) alpha subunit
MPYEVATAVNFRRVSERLHARHQSDANKEREHETDSTCHKSQGSDFN